MPTSPSAILFTALLAMAGATFAADAPTNGPTPAQRAGRNVYLGGGNVRPHAMVEGDLMAAGGKVILDREVKGDASLAGGSIEVSAAVGDDLRAVGGDVNIAGAVGGELIAAGGNVTLASAARVGRGASFLAGVLTVDGTVAGPIEANAQRVVINGAVGGDVELRAAEIELGPNANIAGSLRYTSPGEMRRAPGASVAGAVQRQEPVAMPHDSSPGHRWQRRMELDRPSWMGWGLTYMALLACAGVLLLVLPGYSNRAAEAIGRTPWLALLVGFGALVGIPAFAGLLFISLLGIPVGILVLAVYPALLLLGYLIGVLFVTRRALVAARAQPAPSYVVTMGFFAVCLLLVALMGRLPFVGALLMALIAMFGLGASVLAWPWRTPAGPMPPPSAA